MIHYMCDVCKKIMRVGEDLIMPGLTGEDDKGENHYCTFHWEMKKTLLEYSDWLDSKVYSYNSDNKLIVETFLQERISK